jgi:hypothetical protein
MYVPRRQTAAAAIESRELAVIAISLSRRVR